MTKEQLEKASKINNKIASLNNDIRDLINCNHTLGITHWSNLDCDKPFYFPDSQPLTQRLADVLEPEVDESYYLSDNRINGLIASTKKRSKKDADLPLHQKIVRKSQTPSAHSLLIVKRIIL